MHFFSSDWGPRDRSRGGIPTRGVNFGQLLEIGSRMTRLAVHRSLGNRSAPLCFVLKRASRAVLSLLGCYLVHVALDVSGRLPFHETNQQKRWGGTERNRANLRNLWVGSTITIANFAMLFASFPGSHENGGRVIRISF